MNEKVKIFIRVFCTDGGKLVTQYARFSGKI